MAINMKAFTDAEQALDRADHAVKILAQLKPAIVALKETAGPLVRADQDLTNLKALVAQETQALKNLQERVAGLQSERDALVQGIEKYKKILGALNGA